MNAKNAILTRCPAAWASSAVTQYRRPDPDERAEARLLHRDWRRASKRVGGEPGPEWADLSAAEREKWVLVAMLVKYRQHIRDVRESLRVDSTAA